ncbi:MAG: EAL domain-containing protein, partial [Lachnospiraceae bacterium]|nr:EAL domain-containing protein [Lachnospiraceae bacterium]
AKDLSLCCLAEGVEKKEQVEYLRKIDCDKIQGYYYSKPLPGEEYVRKIREIQ